MIIGYFQLLLVYMHCETEFVRVFFLFWKTPQGSHRPDAGSESADIGGVHGSKAFAQLVLSTTDSFQLRLR